MNNISKQSLIEKCSITKLPLLDPYLLKNESKIKFKDDLELGMHYDFFNVGLLGLMCIIKSEFYLQEFLDITRLSKHLENIDNWQLFLKKCRDNLINDDDLYIYYQNICKYCLGELKDRKNSKFVQDKIILDEKYNNSSLW